MLYLIDEYIKRGHKKTPELLRFEAEEKNLHEMTSEEVNSITAAWEAVEPSVALSMKRRIAQYLDWLTDNRVNVCLEAKDINIPTIAKDTVCIYSTNDIQKYFDMLERVANDKDGKSPSVNLIKMHRAVSVLAFYGLTDEEILDLRWDDVTSGGVKGYDISLTEQDVTVLLAYKNLDRFDNRHLLQGNKYVRTSSASWAADKTYLNRYIQRLNVNVEYEFLKDVLKTLSLRTFGKFDNAYHKEKACGEIVSINARTPKWFSDIFKVKSTWLTKMKRDYIAYRERRDLISPLPTQVGKIKQQTKEEIIKRINTIHDKIFELTQEVQTLTSKLNQLD